MSFLPVEDNAGKNLKDGDRIVIKTGEDFKDPEFCYLGLWSSWSPYYYKKGDSFSKEQQWILKKSGEKGGEIAYGDKVCFVNVEHNDCYLCISSDGEYLYATRNYIPETCDFTIL